MSYNKEIIPDLEKLLQIESIDISGFFDVTAEFKYEPIRHYINSLINQSKPESASSELFRDIIKDILNIKSFSEVNIGNGFIDFALKENSGNPILLELKPLFKLIKNKNLLKIEVLEYTDYKEQILKYLKNNEYVILTDMKDAYLFSRNAIIDFEPFQVLNFPELLNKFREQANLWDTIRRIEDDEVKIDLDQSFFDDLKNWYREFKSIEFLENERFSKEELIVLLLNKIIFIKTLEDFGLIHFKHLTDEYLNKKDKWEAKGPELILDAFFNELENYFDYFYNTELFKTRFWPNVKKEKNNLERFQRVFETALGLDAWNRTFGRGMIHYNYRLIDEDIFGKAYETFIAENKKDEGIYYTPKQITQYMATSLVDFLFKPIIDEILQCVDKNNTDYVKANALLNSLYGIKIIDPCSGSGSFLIKVFREIYTFYKKIDDATSWVDSISVNNLFDLPATYKSTVDFRIQHNLNDHISLISKIILRHIHAIDVDERALETAKTNIWKEAIKLNPKIYNYKKLNGKNSHILPDLELNFITSDSLADVSIEEQIKFLTENYRKELILLHQLRTNYLDNPFSPEVVEKALQIRSNIYLDLKEKLANVNKPTLICLQFFYCYFNNNGEPLEVSSRGFNGVISNPPWEAIKPIEKEFAKISKGKLDILDFKKWFNKELETDKDFKDKWEEYSNFYTEYNIILSSRYKYQGIGDPNYYKLFIERDLELLQADGQLEILVPSGIQIDKGSSDLRKIMTTICYLKELICFENRGFKVRYKSEERTLKFFPQVDSRYKFSILNIQKILSKENNIINSKFYLNDPNELYEKPFIPYTVEMIKKFSPVNLSIMEFRDVKDFRICTKIRNEHILLGEMGYRFTAEFHMTNDSSLFHKEKDLDETKKYFPLFEGKMIHQFNSQYDSPNYFLEKIEAGKVLHNSEIKKLKSKFDLGKEELKRIKYKLAYESYRLAYRAIGSSTNERTIISSIIPQNIFIGHSLNYLITYKYKLIDGKIEQVQIPKETLVVLMCLFNSLILNYYIRNKISANLTTNFIFELPIPKISKKQKEYIVNAGMNLLLLINDPKSYSELKKDLNITVKKDVNIIKLRSELEVFIAKEIYGLSFDDWEYITSTFTYGGHTETRRELTEIINTSLSLF